MNAHSEHEMEPVTEDDVHELKTDLSSWRCELLDILHRNGMDIGSVDKKEKTVLGKKMKVWERRLMKDFQVSGPVNPADIDLQEEVALQQHENESNVERWRRVARLAVLTSAEHRWTQVVRNAVKSSQIGKSTSRASLQNQQSLKRAMEEAKRLSQKSPLPSIVPVELPATTADTIRHVLHDIVNETENDAKTSESKTPEPIRNGIGSQPFESIIQPKSTSSVNFVNETTTKVTPLLPLRTSPPRVIKRKAPILSNTQSTEQPSISTQSTFTTSTTPAVSTTSVTAIGTSITVTTTIVTAATSTIAKSTTTATVTKTTSSSSTENQSKPAAITVTNTSFISVKDGNSSIRARPKASYSPKLSIPSLTVTSDSNKDNDREKLVAIPPHSKSSRGGWL